MAQVSLHSIVDSINGVIETVQALTNVNADEKAAALNNLSTLKSNTTAQCSPNPQDQFVMHITDLEQQSQP